MEYLYINKKMNKEELCDKLERENLLPSFYTWLCETIDCESLAEIIANNDQKQIEKLKSQYRVDYNQQFDELFDRGVYEEFKHKPFIITELITNHYIVYADSEDNAEELFQHMDLYSKRCGFIDTKTNVVDVAYKKES